MKNTPPAFVPAYHNRLFRLSSTLLVALGVSAYGGASFLASLLSPAFYLEAGTTLVFTLLIIEWIHMVTCRLDRLYGWTESPFRRLALQITFGILLPSIIEFLLAASWFGFFRVNILETTYPNFAYPLIVGLIVVLNAYYFTHYLYLLLKKSRVIDQLRATSSDYPAPNPYNEGIIVKSGESQVFLPYREIQIFFHQNRYNFATTTSGEQYIVSQTLDHLEKTLNGNLFFRLNRKMLVHRQCCAGWSNAGGGKLLIDLTVSVPSGLNALVSQEKARSFRTWWSTGNSV